MRNAVGGVWILAALTSVLVAAGIGCVDNRPKNLGEGEECRSTAECGPGLECVGLVCEPTQRPQFSDQERRDVGFAPPERPRDAGPGEPDLPPPADVPPPQEDVPPQQDVPPDMPDVDEPPPGLLCNPGERQCATNLEIRICDMDGQRFSTEQCAQGNFCQGGQCVPRADCQDADGDGFNAGPDCVGQIDCNDDNPRIFPGAAERCNGLDDDCDARPDEDTQQRCSTACGTGFEVCIDGRFAQCSARQPEPEICGNRLDDDCNGQIDENCAECEPGTCPQGELCVDGQCREAPRNECLFQNQPCDPFVGADTREYQCVDFAGGDNGLCFGRCQLGAQDPDATCPEPGSVCAFEFDVGDGLCLLECDPVTQTGCFEDQGCIALSDTGGCTPTGDGEEGEVCNAFEGVFDQCEAGLVCTQLSQNTETCERLCNPFSTLEGVPSVCQGETACFSLDETFGFCVDSLGQPEGSRCRNFGGFAMCEEDVLCHPTGRRGAECQRLCRLENGDEDCINGGRCRFSDFFGSDTVGVCQ